MELSIIITSYHQAEILKTCIESIKQNLVLSDYEIIEIDSDSQEDTKLMMKDFPEIKFIPLKDNSGFQEAVRRGYEVSSGRHILVMNGDMVVKPGAIEKLLGYIKNDPSVGLVGPKLFGFNDELQPSCFRYYTPLTIIYRRTILGKFQFAQKHLDNFLMKDFDHNSLKDVDWLMGSALMTSRKAIDEVGLMDPRFKMYFEDVDWCRRFWENGFRVVYNPDAQMYHYHGKGSAGKNLITLITNKLAWLHLISAVKFFLKYAGKPNPRLQFSPKS